MKLLSIVVCCGAWAAGQASALELITPAEAKLPSAYQEVKRAGLTRGPGIDVSSPGASVKKDALALKVDFKSRGGVAIDPKSVKVLYLKSPPVDLTERVRAAVTADGIAIQDAQVPAGEHQLRVEVSDAEGRSSSKLVNFVAQ
jgi:hypothetical protein